MKKILSLCLAFLLLFAVGCETETSSSSSTEKEAYTFIMPDGAPVLAVINLIKNYPKIDGHKINYKTVSSTNLVGEYTQNADIAVLPTNAAANLYNKGADIRLASVNVFGVMYMIGSQPLNSLEDLKGTIIYSIGQGNTPELMLKYFLRKANVDFIEGTTVESDKVTISYKADGSEVIKALKMRKDGDPVAYGALGQPAVSKAVKALNMSVVFDYQAEWKKYNDSNGYPQAGVAVKSKVAADTSFMTALYSALSENATYLEENPSLIKPVLTDINSSFKDFDFTAEMVTALNLGFIKAKDAKSAIEAYFNGATEQQENKAFFGGKLPSDEFYLG